MERKNVHNQLRLAVAEAVADLPVIDIEVEKKGHPNLSKLYEDNNNQHPPTDQPTDPSTDPSTDRPTSPTLPSNSFRNTCPIQ